MAKTEDEMEAALRLHAGFDFREPRKVISSIVFSDSDTIPELIARLTAFAKQHENCTISPAEYDGDCFHRSGFQAERLETSAEVEKRVSDARSGFDQLEKQRQALRKADYERLKREFGDA